ncbi:hypothetical protein [Singulisphaera sp. PoT]
MDRTPLPLIVTDLGLARKRRPAGDDASTGSGSFRSSRARGRDGVA